MAAKDARAEAECVPASFGVFREAIGGIERLSQIPGLTYLGIGEDSLFAGSFVGHGSFLTVPITYPLSLINPAVLGRFWNCRGRGECKTHPLRPCNRLSADYESITDFSENDTGAEVIDGPCIHDGDEHGAGEQCQTEPQ